MRASPAIPIVRRLLAEGARVSAFDPAARDEARRIFADGPVHLRDDLASAVADADAAVIVTRWEEFRGLPDALRATGRTPLLVDARRMLEKTAYERYTRGLGYNEVTAAVARGSTPPRWVPDRMHLPAERVSPSV